MADWLVIEDYSATPIVLRAGSIIDDVQYDVEALRAEGLAVLAWEGDFKTTFAPTLAGFLSFRSFRSDADGDLAALVTAWQQENGGSGGQSNTGANVGSGAGVFRDKTGVTLNFRTLTSDDASVDITQNADTVDLSVQGAGGGVEALNGLTGEIDIVAGAGVTVTEGTGTITIATTGGVNTASADFQDNATVAIELGNIADVASAHISGGVIDVGANLMRGFQAVIAASTDAVEMTTIFADTKEVPAEGFGNVTFRADVSGGIVRFLLEGGGGGADYKYSLQWFTTPKVP